MLIGQLARRSGSSPRSLRYYEQQGLISSRRDPNGYRRYSADAEDRLRQIKVLLDAGFTTVAIRTILPCLTGPGVEVDLCPQVAGEVQRALLVVNRELDAMHRRRVVLVSMLDASVRSA